MKLEKLLNECSPDSKSQRLSLLLDQIWKNGSVSRAHLHKVTGLALPTITRLIQDLKNTGVLIETEKGESSGGRQPMMLRLNPNTGVVIALDFSSVELSGAIFDSSNQRLLMIHEPFLGMRQDVIERQVIAFCHKLMGSPVIQSRRVLGIGISVPGTVDIENGIILSSSNMHLRDYPICQILENIFFVPVYIEHDTAAASMAENIYGAGRGHDNLIYIMVSNGIGAGIIINNEVYRGLTGQAGEFGHITIERNGQICACGKRGCLEAEASVPAMLASARNVYQRQQRIPYPITPEITSTPFSLEALKQATLQGDPVAKAIIEHSTDNLALAISMMIYIIDINFIIVGGEVIQIGEPYFDRLRTSLKHFLTDDQDITIVPACLGDMAALQGICMFVLKKELAKNIFQ